MLNIRLRGFTLILVHSPIEVNLVSDNIECNVSNKSTRVNASKGGMKKVVSPDDLMHQPTNTRCSDTLTYIRVLSKTPLTKQINYTQLNTFIIRL